jgi:predicted transcriptional regulator
MGRGTADDISPYQMAYMQMLRDKGLTVKRVAEMLGVCEATVYNYTKNEKLPDIPGWGSLTEICVELTKKAGLNLYVDIMNKDKSIILEKCMKALKDAVELEDNVSHRDAMLIYERLLESKGERKTLSYKEIQELYEKEKGALLVI